MMQTNTPVSTEWSFPIEASKVTQNGENYTLNADQETLEALEKRLDILDLQNLEANIHVSIDLSGIIHIKGKVTAEVTQSCVISLDPITETLNEYFEAYFTTQSNKKVPASDHYILSEMEDPEPVINGTIDIGETAIQHLALSINPYPRHPDAKSPDISEQGSMSKKLAALKNLKTA